MEKQDFRINTKIVWILVIGNIFMTTIGALAKIQHWEYSQLLLTVGIVFFFSTWIIILSDMTMNKIYNKTFWIMSMFIIPGISGVFYLIMRNKLLRLGNKFEH
ncbi:MAG TPA: hypothetical protein VIN72_06880 [Lutibacter sp.]